MNLYSIDTGLFKLDGGALFGVVPKSIWQKSLSADENNLCSIAMRCLLIEEGNRLVLVDTGIGNKQDEKFFSHYYLHGSDTLEKSLNKNGFTKSDITDVFLTHLHFDHVGGAVERVDGKLVPAFQNAVYWSNEKHWNWAIHPNEREKASFLRDNIIPIQESGQPAFITDSQFDGLFDIRFVNGHTESMMLPQIRWRDRTIVYTADLIPTTAHLPIPYVPAYDMFPLQTLQEKKSFLEEAEENNYILFFEHDSEEECCTLKRTEKGVRTGQLFNFKEI